MPKPEPKPTADAIRAAHVASELKDIDGSERAILRAILKSDIDPIRLNSEMRRVGVTEDELVAALSWMKESTLIIEIPASGHRPHNSLQVNPRYETALVEALHEVAHV